MSFIHPNTLLVIIISIISVITDLFCSMTVCSIVIVTLLILEVFVVAVLSLREQPAQHCSELLQRRNRKQRLKIHDSYPIIECFGLLR